MTEIPTQRAPAGGRKRAIVREIHHPTERSVALRLEVKDRIDHLPGQHYAIRLVAEDGYVAQRSYSIASDPGDELVEFYIDRLADGEVSGFLADGVALGDELDVQGPIGGWFVWRGEGPAVAIGGGSGVAPFISMLRHAKGIGRPDLLRLAVSVRTMADLGYADELAQAGALVALTREDAASGRSAGRLTAEDIAPLLTDGAEYFICGSAAFAESATDMLIGLGVAPDLIRLERFGPTS